MKLNLNIILLILFCMSGLSLGDRETHHEVTNIQLIWPYRISLASSLHYIKVIMMKRLLRPKAFSQKNQNWLQMIIIILLLTISIMENGIIPTQVRFQYNLWSFLIYKAFGFFNYDHGFLIFEAEDLDPSKFENMFELSFQVSDGQYIDHNFVKLETDQASRTQHILDKGNA